MTLRYTSLTSLTALLLILIGTGLHAQNVDSISANPAAVQLRRIWMIKPDILSHAQVGIGVGSVGDINSDGISDFAVLAAEPWKWSVYLGGRDSIAYEPVWTFDSGMTTGPVVGDFRGDGQSMVGFARGINTGTSSLRHYWLHLFDTDGSRIADTASLIWDSWPVWDPPLALLLNDIHSADLDGDGADELIVVVNGRRRDLEVDRHAEIWIYQGGSGFQVDTPTVILRDPQENNSRFRMHLADLDGDHRIDMLTVMKTYFENQLKYQFYWGSNTLPTADRQPDRSILNSTILSQFLYLADVDGDGIDDLINPGINIWRSGAGKNARTRPYDWPDVDNALRSTNGLEADPPLGYLNSKRYQMIAGLQPGGVMLGFSGGPNGPDAAYEAFYTAGSDDLMGYADPRGSIGDVNGDGWDDLMCANPTYPGHPFDAGIALILAGGPYIPTDDPSLDVRHVAVGDRRDALSLWPNPVREELNIAWRGDLQRMPRRFEVHDVTGRLIATGSVSDGEGAALWHCQQIPAGSYLLSVFDAGEQLLVSERFIKH